MELNQFVTWSMDQPRPHHNNQTQTTNSTLRVTQKELDSLIVEYCSNMNSHSQNSMVSKLSNRYSQVEQQIREVVQMRKNMEKLVQIDALQSQHFESMQKLIIENVESQKTIQVLSKRIKQLESKNVEEMIVALNDRLKSLQYSPNVCLSNEIIMLANQISRSFANPNHFQSRAAESIEFQIDNDDLSLKSKNQEELNWIIKQQNEKYELLKNIYGCKFKEITIRDQLISEREHAFFQYSVSNHELIDVLLRQKEREKNLSRTQREKFQELLKARHQIELENEHLNYHENNLVSYYEIELTRLKEQMVQKEKVWEAERELLMSNESAKNGEIQKLITQLKKTLQQKDELIQSNKELENKHKILQQDMERALQLKNEFEEKMESLQSQLNQNILKLSQSSRTKSEVTQKLEEANKKIAEMENLSATLKNRISALQAQISKNQALKQQLLHKNESLGKRGEVSQTQIVSLEQKIQYLQNQLTQSFIINNAEVKRLQEEIQQKNHLIQQLQSQRFNILREIEEKRVVQPAKKSQFLDFQEANRLKIQLKEQLQRQSERKQRLLDEAIQRISNLLY